MAMQSKVVRSALTLMFALLWIGVRAHAFSGPAAPGQAQTNGPDAATPKVTQLASLERSLLPLRIHFNMHTDQPRVVAILSPS